MKFDQYFDERAGRFSAFYRSERVSRAIGRGALFDRLRFAVDIAVSIQARSVLDVGCGSGPLFEPLAAKGIVVTGLEPAAAMLELANLQAAQFPGLVNVRAAKWEDLAERDAYDLAVALGVFDYVATPDDLLARMARAAPSVVASFPGPGARTRLRQIRYGIRNVEVHPYTQDDISSLADRNGLAVADVLVVGRAGRVVHFRRSAA